MNPPVESNMIQLFHYFMECPNYAQLRIELFNAIVPYTDADIGTILYESEMLGINKNIAVIDAVHNYIIKSERF